MFLFHPQCTKTPHTFATAANRWRVGHDFLPRLMGEGKDGRREQELPDSLAESPLPFHGVWWLSHVIRNCCEDQPAPKATWDWPARYRLPRLWGQTHMGGGYLVCLQFDYFLSFFFFFLLPQQILEATVLPLDLINCCHTFGDLKSVL